MSREYVARGLAPVQAAQADERITTQHQPYHGELRGMLARLALAASQIAAAYERYGPDPPWELADPTSWKCSPRFCRAWRSCLEGRGL